MRWTKGGRIGLVVFLVYFFERFFGGVIEKFGGTRGSIEGSYCSVG